MTTPPLVFTAGAVEDLRRIGPALAPRVVRILLALEHEPESGRPLVDPTTGLRCLTIAGRWRAVYEPGERSVTVWEVWAEGARSDGDAYAEALHAMQSAGTPDLVQLARILRRLGRITGTVPVAPTRAREPVPDWLAGALVERAGLDPLAVATMDARTAFEAWNRAT